MANVHVLAFNKTMLELLNLLETRFPGDTNVHGHRAPLELALRYCSSTAISRFMTEMMTHGKQVDERDEEYFLAHSTRDADTAVGAELWGQMDKELRDTVWRYVQKMKNIGALYYAAL